MPLTVTCRCGKWFAAPDHLAGTTAACPSCGSPIAIQASGTAAAQPAQSRAAPTPKAQPAAAGLVVSCACGQSYKAPESLRGQSLPCPACGRAIPIPAAAQPKAPAAVGQFGLDPLGSSDPLADPLMSATLAGTPLAGQPAFDPLGRPMMSSATYGSAGLSRQSPASSQDGPNWILIGSIGGVALVLLVLVGVIVATSMSGGGTPVAANSTPAVNTPPATTDPINRPVPIATDANPAANPPTATTTLIPGVPSFNNSATPGATAVPGSTSLPLAPMSGREPGSKPTGATSAAPGTAPAGTPAVGPAGTQVGAGIGGGVSRPPPVGATGVVPGSGQPGGSSAKAGGSAATNQNVEMVKIIPRSDPKGSYDTPSKATPNPKGFATALPVWHGDSKAKLVGVFKVGDADNRTTMQAHYSWMHNLLPYMGHQDIYDKFDLTKPLHDNANIKFGAILVPEYLVPGNPLQRWDGYPFDHFALTHFVGMSGIEDARNVVAGKFDRSDPRAGVFGYDRIATPAEIKDGTSNTIMVIGVGDLANPWVMGGGATIRGARLPYFDKLSGFGSHGQNGPITMFADGSVRMISPNVDPAVFRAMCTIHGAETVDLQTAAPPFKLD